MTMYIYIYIYENKSSISVSSALTETINLDFLTCYSFFHPGKHACLLQTLIVTQKMKVQAKAH